MHKFRPGDVVRYIKEDEDVPDYEEVVIGKEEWEEIGKSEYNRIFHEDCVYTKCLDDGTYLGHCSPRNFELIRSGRDIIFKDAL